jgi:uncharacterized protein (TIGR00369 family)
MPTSDAPTPSPPFDDTAVSDAHLRRLERVYHAANTNRLIPAKLTLGAGCAELEMHVGEPHQQAVGGIHGMLYFKAVDEAGFYAANSLVDDVFLTTASANLNLLGPMTEGTMRARADVVHRTRSSLLVEVVVRDGAGAQIARASCTFVRGKVPLPALLPPPAEDAVPE